MKGNGVAATRTSLTQEASSGPGRELDRLRARITELERRERDAQLVERQLLEAMDTVQLLREEQHIQEETLRVADAEVVALRRKEASLFALAPVGCAYLDAGGIIHDINLAGAEMLGRSRERLAGKPFRRNVQAQWRGELAVHIGHVFDGDCQSLELELRRADGSVLPVVLDSLPVADGDGRVEHCYTVMLDISARRQAERELELAGAIIEHTLDGVMITDAESRILAVNPSFERTTGYNRDEIVGRTPRVLKSGRHDAAFYREMWRGLSACGHWQGEVWNRRKDGETYPELLSLNAVTDPDGEVTHYVGVFSDISLQEDMRRELHNLAYYDPITGLPNRHLFLDRLAQGLAQARRGKDKVGLMFLDLDRFKLINDSLGHDVGDVLLKRVAERLQGCVREVDTVGRMGGDEFTIILPGVHSTADTMTVARKVLTVLDQPLALDMRSYFVGASIGVSHYPDDGEDPHTLIKHADAAMYRAKELGRNQVQMFHSEINRRTGARLDMETDLRGALARDELEVHYQPLVDLRSGRMHAVEALARWRHPRLGLLLPDHFIPTAEETGLIVALGDWVLERACTQLKAWHEAGMGPLQVAVNLSPHQFLQTDLLERIRATLADTGLPPSCLELEITESAAMPNPDYSIKTLHALRTLGMRISIDDFGTGYSSFSHLRRLPINKLKIAEDFIRDLPGSTDAASIVEAIINMAHSLTLDVVAEGVERPEQVEFLASRGCDYIQGNVCSAAMEAQEVESTMKGFASDRSCLSN